MAEKVPHPPPVRPSGPPYHHLPYYRWWWHDYRASQKVQLMDWRQQGMYRWLLDECWHQGSIPADPRLIARLLHEPEDRFVSEDWPYLEPCFRPKGKAGTRLTNKRIEDERKHALKLSAQGKRGGKNSALARSSKYGTSEPRFEPGFVSGFEPTSKHPDPDPDPDPDPEVSKKERAKGAPGQMPNLSGLLKPMERPKLVMTPEVREAVKRMIERIEQLLNGAGDFKPGQWWGKVEKEHPSLPYEVRLEALAELGAHIAREGVPDTCWGYMETTLDEKSRNYYGSRAEEESKQRREPGRRDPEWQRPTRRS